MDVFPKVWEGIDELIKNKRLISPVEVKFEIEKGEDELVSWVKDRKELFIEIDDAQQDIIRDILAKYPALAGAERDSYHADPWLITLAISYDRLHKEGKTDFTCAVLTEERYKENSLRIPNICKNYGLACFDRIGFFRNEKWQF